MTRRLHHERVRPSPCGRDHRRRGSRARGRGVLEQSRRHQRRRRPRDDQRRLRAARQRSAAAQGVARGRRPVREAEPEHHRQQHLREPMRGPGVVHRDAQGGQRAERLLHLLHRQEPGPGRGPGRRHHVLRERQDGARPEGHRADRAGRGDRGQDALRAAHRQLHPGPDHQPGAVQAGRAQPGQAADHLGRGRAGRQGDHQARPRHLRLRRLQRGQQRRLALLLGDLRRGRPDDQLGRHRGGLQLRPGHRPCCRRCTRCASSTTA